MHNWLKLFGSSMCAFGLCAVIGAANAADPARATSSRTGRFGATTSRMPTMPTLPINAIGNVSHNVPTGSSVVQPVPTPDTPDTPGADGGVRDTAYTIDQCMNELLACINNGALPNGLNDMFNSDLRNSVFNGMGLCATQIDRCRTIRKNCSYIYSSSSNVWIDFNARKVQPEYYSFVLRKTGLTPNQAENTCLLLDRNTYGSSFTAVNASDETTSEYANIVGAYNSQRNNTLRKDNPLGVTVNTTGAVDAQRGHYARWDAANGECLLRVAAYNKDKLISNKWLFGGVGDEKPAEAWKAAGTTFTCNKELFDFGLFTNTKTVAVVGVGGGTLLGAGIGAAAGHGKRAFDCNIKEQREKLAKLIKTNKIGTLNKYLSNDINLVGAEKITEEACIDIVNAYVNYTAIKQGASMCNDDTRIETIMAAFNACDECWDNKEIEAKTVRRLVVNANITVGGYDYTIDDFIQGYGQGEDAELLSEGMLRTKIKESATYKKMNANCFFKTMNLDLLNGTGIYCTAEGKDCKSYKDIGNDIRDLDGVFTSDIVTLFAEGEKSNRLKTTAIGAAVGAGAGGVATAITALVEKNNINCRVGDGLARVSHNKSHSIDSLKDIYVKWNLRLPDAVAPTSEVTDCASWQHACETLTDLNQCANAQISYRPANGNSVTTIYTACKASGTQCYANDVLSEYMTACGIPDTLDIPVIPAIVVPYNP